MFRYFTLLAALNLLDGIFTFSGLRVGLIEEENPLMEILWELNPFCFLFSKIALSVLLLVVAYHFKKIATVFKYWKIVLILSCFAYTAVLIMHLIWISIYLFGA